jgi:hypothetical protein
VEAKVDKKIGGKGEILQRIKTFNWIFLCQAFVFSYEINLFVKEMFFKKINENLLII